MQTVDGGAHAASSSRDADDAASSCQHNYVVTVRALGFWILDFRLLRLGNRPTGRSRGASV
jgi:hypothetical protein